jgi:hypothetical protein
MSWWLQSAIECLNNRGYKDFREKILPAASIPIPRCLIREPEFGEKYGTDPAEDPLFPIHFIWLLGGIINFQVISQNR